MVPAGAPVDSVIHDLLPHLDPGDLIIDGNVYVNAGAGSGSGTDPAWISIQTLLAPQFVTANYSLVIPNNNGTDTSTGSTAPNLIQVPTSFPQGSFSVVVSASIAGVILRDKTTLDKINTKMLATDQCQYSVTANAAIIATGINLGFSWKVAPVITELQGTNNVFISAVDTLIVNYVVIFTLTPPV